MHKVTASAVILTAIAGCSQSEAPSAQWTFEAPAETVATTAFNEYRVSDSGNAVAFSTGTQPFSPDGSRNKMGPAFEQPSSTALLPSANPVPAKSETATTTTADEALALSASQSRTDPIAQVRAYLSAAGKPRSSSFSDGVPYSSQVSLPTAPIYTPTATFFEEAVPVPFSGNTAQAVADLNQQEGNLPRPQTLSTAAAQPTASLPAPSLQVPSLQAPSLQAAANANFISVIPSSGSVTSSSFEDELPVLPAAQPQATRPQATRPQATRPQATRPQTDLAEREVAVAPTLQVSDRTTLRETLQETLRDESLPIGTSILRDLQIDAALNPPTDVLTTDVASTVASRDSVSENVENSAGPEFESPEFAISYAEPATESDLDQAAVRPTLTQLIQTIPQQAERFEEEPLIASFQTAQENLRQVSTTYSNTLWPNISESKPAELEPIELEPLSQSLEREADQLPRAINSPLLEGLETSEDEVGALQTLYMPIPTTPPSEVSAVLVRSAISTLSNDVNSAILLNDLKIGTVANPTESLVPVGDEAESLTSQTPAGQTPAGPETANMTPERPAQPDETARLLSFQIDRPRSHSAQVKSSKVKSLDRLSSEPISAFSVPARISSLSNGHRQRIVWQ